MQENLNFRNATEYSNYMRGKRFLITGLVSAKGSRLNGKIGIHVGVQNQPLLRTLIKIGDDETVYKIQPRNLIPQGYSLKTIHAPYDVMQLAEQERIDQLIGAAQKCQIKQKQWKLCFKYVGPQTNYCFSCHLFGTACYDYCSHCGADYLRLLHVDTNKLMIFYKRCHSCMTSGKDLNLVGDCQDCWNRRKINYETSN